MFIFGSGNQATFQSVFSGKSPELIAREREREREDSRRSGFRFLNVYPWLPRSREELFNLRFQDRWRETQRERDRERQRDREGESLAQSGLRSSIFLAATVDQGRSPSIWAFRKD